MRILVINYEYPPLGGGGGFVTRDLMEEISAQGHDVTVLTSHSKKLAKRETINEVDVLRVPVMFRNELAVASLPSMLLYPPSCVINSLLKLKDKPFDIINTHFAIPSGPAGVTLSKIYKIPNVLSIHGGDIFDPSKSLSPHKTPGLEQTVRLMLKKADRVVAQSSDTRQNAQQFYKTDRQIDIIPLGIKKPEFKRKSRADFGIASDHFVACTIGRLIKRKNIEDSLCILSRLRDQTNLKFIVIGDGPERAQLEKLSYEKNMSEKVRFMGNVSDEIKFQLLAVSDCYISTALHEGFGIVFLEAMECGLPIVSYNRGGMIDFLSSDTTGFLVELGDRDSFAEKLMQLICDKELREKISSFNKKLVEEYYIGRCAERYISLFNQTIEDYK